METGVQQEMKYINLINLEFTHKGRSIYYFRTEGEGVREVANYANDGTDRLRENANKGGRGSKIPKILRT